MRKSLKLTRRTIVPLLLFTLVFERLPGLDPSCVEENVFSSKYSFIVRVGVRAFCRRNKLEEEEEGAVMRGELPALVLARFGTIDSLLDGRYDATAFPFVSYLGLTSFACGNGLTVDVSDQRDMEDDGLSSAMEVANGWRSGRTLRRAESCEL